MNTIDNLAHTDSLEMLAMQSEIVDYKPSLEDNIETIVDNLLFFAFTFFFAGLFGYLLGYAITKLVFLFVL
jgi:membrane protein required for beta-lactamase induction